ncbi:MAG: carbohydrate ABC transporter permease [Anaerolineae bacterium]|nr:carbohydrate ABC transporter permease [Anaerolineae bacterium]
MVQSKTPGALFVRAGIYLVVGIFGVLCILPMIHVLAVSLSDRASSGGGLVGFWPVGPNVEAYKQVLGSPEFMHSLGITIQRTVLGTALNMLITVLVAYPLSKTGREWRGRNVFMGLTVFAMLFSGGLIPLFLTVVKLKLLYSIWALILPGILPIWNVILLMNFFREIPRELEEAAFVDGATHWQILFRVYLPLSLPALATLTLFAAVAHWNSWFDGMIYMQQADAPLQTFLRMVVIENDAARLIRDPGQVVQFSNRSLRAAQIIITILPIVALYPFLQRYFIAGIRLGAVKG